METNPIDLKALKQKIPFSWKIQSSFTNKVSCVAYIDARDVMNLLDSVVGQGNWRDEYYYQGSNLFCKLGILINGEWVYKSDTGEESFSAKEKGIVSDCFKRAGVKWGIGRFLYDMDIIYLPAQFDKKPNGKTDTKVIHDSAKYGQVPSHLVKDGFVNQFKLTEYINLIKNTKG